MNDTEAKGFERLECATCGLPMHGATQKRQIHNAIIHAITTNGDHVVSHRDLVEWYDELDADA